MTEITYMEIKLLFNIQLMVDGVHSLDGLPAARNVVVEHKSELVLVPTPNQHMVARTVLERQ